MSVNAKLALLVARLATNFEGEVIATVHAIRRVLEANGCDLHDLARAVEESSVTRSIGGPLITQLKEVFSKRSLTDFEREFITSVVRQAERPGFKPSPKQQAVIDRILRNRHG